MQRAFDILFSSLALIFFSPLFLIVIVILRFTGEGEIFFLQERVGKEKHLFRLFKFVTMVKDSQDLGTGTLTIKNDPRILPFGGLLRKTKINELPQLLNVFLGEMSLVGPRPLTHDSFSYYSNEIQEAVSKVRPGLSGVGSIVFRDEENILADKNRSKEYYQKSIAPFKGKLESWYVDNYKLSNYFKVIIITIWVIIFPTSKIYWTLFKGVPKPSKELRRVLR